LLATTHTRRAQTPGTERRVHYLSTSDFGSPRRSRGS
jgi:hypothetical protein